MGRFGEAQALLHDADHHAADDVDHHHQEAGDGVAAHELRGAVHGAIKAGFIFQGLAPAPCFLFIDQAGIEIGVDRHLLAGHRIEVEARGHFGDAAGALGDDDEVDDHQDGEDDDPDDEIAAHDEIAEGGDDVTGGLGALVTAGENEPGRGEVEGEPHHRRNQEHRRKGGEFERRLDEQGRHQDQHGEGDRDGEGEIEQQRRQRQQQDHENGHHADREPDVAAPQRPADIGQARQRHGRRAGFHSRSIGHAACSAPSVTFT